MTWAPAMGFRRPLRGPVASLRIGLGRATREGVALDFISLVGRHGPAARSLVENLRAIDPLATIHLRTMHEPHQDGEPDGYERVAARRFNERSATDADRVVEELVSRLGAEPARVQVALQLVDRALVDGAALAVFVESFVSDRGSIARAIDHAREHGWCVVHAAGSAGHPDPTLAIAAFSSQAHAQAHLGQMIRQAADGATPAAGASFSIESPTDESRVPLTLELTPGVTYDDVMAALYRSSDGVPSPVNHPADFVRWVTEPEFEGYAPVSRYFSELRRRRHDLLVAYPEVPGRDAGRYLEWVNVYGCEERHVPRNLFASEAPPEAATRSAYTQAGVNLVGLLNAELGVGEVARRLEQAMRFGTIPHSTTAFERTRSRLRSTYRSDPPRFDTNLLCLNADSLPGFTQDVGLGFFEGRYTIGVWFWETSTFPTMFHSAFSTVDELWAASDYIAEILRAAAPADTPIVRMPLPIVRPATNDAFDLTTVGIPADRFTFLCSFDYLSVPGRKNPLGTIEAFTAAFTPDEGPVLVVKSINAREHPRMARDIADAAGSRRDIVLFDGYLDSRDNASLTANSDCYVSLHRSEGFGLNLADAIALGVPLIATGATGNMEFCRAEDCHLVGAEAVPVGPGHFPYAADAIWMEPSIEEAARLMRSIASAPQQAKERARRARERVLADHTMQRTALFIRDRIATVRADNECDAMRRNAASEAVAPVSRRTALLRSLGLVRSW